jgi:hypothetical protein
MSKPRSRHAANPVADVLTSEDMAQVARAVLPKAKDGDQTAALIVLRIWERLEPTIELDLPEVTDAKSLAEAHARVISAVARRQITPRQALDVSRLLDWRRRALETVEYESTLSKIEEKQSNAKRLRDEFEAKLLP